MFYFIAPRYRRFPLYNQKINEKYREQNDGNDLPHRLRNIVGFQDGTRFEVCRPGGDPQIQMRLFNGKDRIHCLEFQTIVFPDGMVGDLYGPVLGARHDSYTNRVILYFP